MPFPPRLPVLVAGATGLLGGAIARRLMNEGWPIRALARTREKLQPLADAGADVFACDLRDATAVEESCRGVGDVVSTANNVQGSGPTSPRRVDLAAYRSLAGAAARAGVTRWIHVSARGVATGGMVDYFRVKHAIDGVVRASGIPWVLLQPTAFMEIWIDTILADAMRTKGTAILFGGGRRLCNYVAVDDVARYAAAIVTQPRVTNEVVEVGGPSTVDVRTLVALIERAMGTTVKRRSVPLPVLRLGSVLLGPFNEVAARMMALGAFSASADAPFPEWRRNAERFGVEPITVEQYIERRYGRSSSRPTSS